MTNKNRRWKPERYVKFKATIAAKRKLGIVDSITEVGQAMKADRRSEVNDSITRASLVPVHKWSWDQMPEFLIYHGVVYKKQPTVVVVPE